jgi:TP901 family phage tail tape measure protein
VSDRTVVVRLMAEVGQYQQQMAAAGRATDRLAAQTKKTERMIGGTLGSIRGMITTFGVPLIGASLVKSFTDFEQQMARVKAVGDPFGASTEGAKRMQEVALKAGQAYGFTATEVGLAMEELAKAGVKTDEILSGVLDSALTLAAAGSIGLADAAKHIAVIQSQFELKGLEDPTRIANQLSQAANATVSGVNEMATSLSYVGPIAHSMGMSLEDTVATLSMFNQAGLDADMAGTTLRGLLTSLTSPSHLAATEMAKLNLELYDSDGKMRNIYEIADELQTKIGGLGEAEKAYTIGKIASNAQLQGMLLLMKGGGKGIDAMRKLILAQATAEDVAKAKTASFTGEVKKLGSAIESAAIKTMQKLAPVMESMVTHAQDLTNWFGDLGGSSQLAAAGLAAQLIVGRRVTSGLGSFSGAVKKAAQDAATYRQTLEALAQQRPPDMPVKQFDEMNRKLLNTKAALEESRRETGLVKTAMGDMRASVDGAASGSEKAAARFKGSMGVMKAGASNLLAFVGGPWLAGIGAAVIVFSAIAEEANKSKQRQEELSETLGDLGEAYRKFGTYTGDAQKALIKKDETLQDLAAHTEKYGVTIKQVIQASAGEIKQQREVIKGLKERQEAAERVQIAYGRENIRSGFTLEQFKAARSLTNQLDELIPALEKTFAKEILIADATRAVEAAGLAEYVDKMGMAFADTNPGIELMAQNASVLGAEQANAADKTQALKSSLDMLHSSINSVSDAMAAMRSTSVRDTFYENIPAKEAKEAIEGHEKQDYEYYTEKVKHPAKTRQMKTRDPLTGKMVSTTETTKAAWSEDVRKRRLKGKPYITGAKPAEAAQAERWISKFKPEMIDRFTGKFSTMVKVNGKFRDDLTQTSIAFNSFMSGQSAKSLDLINAVFTDATRNGADMGTAAMIAGLRFRQMRKELVDQLEPIVKNRAEAEALADAYMVMPEHLQTTFAQPGMREALENANTLGLTIEQLPGDKAVYILAHTEEGAEKLRKLGRKVIDLKDGRFKVKFDNYGQAMKDIATVAKPRDAKVTPVIQTPKYAAPTSERVPETKAKFKVPKAEALFRGMEYEVNVKPKISMDANNVDLYGKMVNFHAEGAGKTKRWGGIETRADGGLREAKIASGGQPLYQWAERETGGEAFIPRLGNMARSLSILEQAAAWYGQEIVPAGRMPAAAGAARPMAPVTSRAAAGAMAPAPVTQVRVFLGNEELTDKMRVVVEQHSSQSALQASWGRRA